MLVVVVASRTGRETSTSQRTENGVTLLRPAPPASVSFRPRSRTVVLGEGSQVYAPSTSLRPPLFPAYFRSTEYVTVLCRTWLLQPSSSKLIMNMG